MDSKKSGIVSKYTFDWSLQKSSKYGTVPPQQKNDLTTLVPPKTQQITAFSQLLKTLSPFVFCAGPVYLVIFSVGWNQKKTPCIMIRLPRLPALFFFLKGNPSKKKYLMVLRGRGGHPSKPDHDHFVRNWYNFPLSKMVGAFL